MRIWRESEIKTKTDRDRDRQTGERERYRQTLIKDSKLNKSRMQCAQIPK